MRSTKLLGLITFLNFMVFLGWFFSLETVGPQWMMDHFLVSWSALEEGRLWVLLTSVFSHSSFIHLMLNMFVLQGFGTILNRLMGTVSFLNFYFIAGITGSFMHALVSLVVLNDPALPALGASGAIAGIILLFSLLFPQEKLLLLGLIPIKARWASVLIVGLDLWGLFEQKQGGGLPIGHGAHLGGALMGIIWFLWMRYSKIKKGNHMGRPF